MKKITAIIMLLLTQVIVACTVQTVYTIEFETNGGSAMASIEFNNTYTLEDLESLNPQKVGYSFDGWFLDQTLSDTNKLTEDVTSSVTLYAKWAIISYTVTFNLDEGLLAENQVQSFTILEEVLLLQPTKPGYIFLGWTSEAESTDYVDRIEVGTTGNQVFYAQWQSIDEESYHIVFKNYDGSILDEVFVGQGIVPVYGGPTPTKPSTSTHSYTFVGWDKTVEAAQDNTIYIAAFEAVAIEALTEIDPTDLNAIFNFDVYALLPAIHSEDYDIFDNSNEYFNDAYIDLFDWSEADLMAYEDLLFALLAYDEVEEAYVLGNYFIYVYADDEYIPGTIVYGMNIYEYLEEETPVDPTEPEGSPFNKDELNAIFGFDIYQLLPNFESSDALITDLSDDTETLVYIDIFTWSEQDADDYDLLLEGALAYDTTEEAYIVGNYFLYIFYDDEMIPGTIVYGIAIYGETSDETPVDPIDGVYYSFNIQNTTSQMTSSYKDQIDLVLDFAGSQGKVVVKASHIAHITGSTPGGLDNGMIFAANVSGNANPTVYLEVDTLGNQISSMSFEIQARSNYSVTLLGAKLQVFVGGVWTDLEGGSFYSELSTTKTTITILNIHASKFRLLFQGTGATSNGGQFMISQVNLYQETPKHELWSDVVSDLEAKFDDLDLNTYLPAFEGLSQMTLTKVNDNEYKIDLETFSDIQTYVGQLLTKDYEKDDALSALRGSDVYVYVVNDDVAYGLYFIQLDNEISIVIFRFDASMDDVVLNNLSPRQSVNDYEVDKFGMSGLPSTGSFDVLVVPVEIQGAPFELNYLSKLNTVFNGTSEDTGWESVSSYYYKSSFGKLDLTFDVVPKYVTTHNKAYYENEGQNGDQFVILEALLALDPTLDFSKYDANDDGYIDSVIFIYSAEYDYDVDPWWAWVFSAQFGEADDIGLLDGLAFEYYMWGSYSFIEDTIPGYQGLILNSETYIHELGHLMGIPDYYPYEGEHEFGPLGGFDMMDYNVGDHGPFNKLVLGWLEPVVAQAGTYEVTLDSYATDTDQYNNTLLIPYNASDLNDGDAFDEYLLIIFYTPAGLYDAHGQLQTVLEHAGVVIYHVDARLNTNVSFWDDYFKNDSEGSSNFLVQILEADKNNSIPGNSTISQSDILTFGSINLNTYQWHQGGNINVSIAIQSVFNNNSESITIQVTVS